MSVRLAIATLGAQGDGVAESAAGPIFVPFALPGEVVDAEPAGSRAALIGIIEASTERREPPCPHFGRCGGCDLQHTSDALYRGFKRDLLVEALRSRGLETEVGDLVTALPASRRRAIFSGVREDNRIVFGFFEALTNRVASIEVCLVVVPEIASRLADFKGLALIVADRKRPMRMIVTATETGLDIALSDTAKATENLRQAIVAFALKRDFARVTLEGEIMVETRKPTVRLSGIPVAIPPGGFLQAVASAEAAMTDRVAAHLGTCKTVADLFAGLGTFALRLAQTCAVQAVEGEADAIEALDRARRAASGLKPIAVERRDLFRRPLTAKELGKFDGVVFDPPRAGADVQAREIAASKVKRVAAVSCNPATLARDLRILVDGGFRLVSATPIDQFVWSHHLETVALLER